jgi:N6-L-threonylcarbamoyladenine synthase
MRAACHFHKRIILQQFSPRRHLLTLAIETSCDDTSVAVLEKHNNGSATLHFNSKITSDNRSYGGVYPVVAHESHQQHIAALVKKALLSLPPASRQTDLGGGYDFVSTLAFGAGNYAKFHKKPDFVTVTRGPGMRASLITGVDTAKGLAVAWNVPLLGVNHMQAHALTPRLVAALDRSQFGENRVSEPQPSFPFLTLLVSGGHTMLVHSKALCDHEILADTTDLAIGDMLDKVSRDIIPPSILESAPDVMYGPILESFAFPDDGTLQYRQFDQDRQETSDRNFRWSVNMPYAKLGSKGAAAHMHEFSFSGIGSSVKRVVETIPETDNVQRAYLAMEAMRIAFSHLASRVLLALDGGPFEEIKTLVVSGGVASNKYLKHVLRTALDAAGYSNIALNFPPPKYCTDNAAMIAWTGMEMYEAGWRTDLSAMAARKWSIDPKSEDGGIVGLGGWSKVEL